MYDPYNENRESEYYGVVHFGVTTPPTSWKTGVLTAVESREMIQGHRMVYLSIIDPSLEDSQYISSRMNLPLFPEKPKAPNYKTTAVITGTASERDIESGKLKLILTLSNATEQDREHIKGLVGSSMSLFFPERPKPETTPTPCKNCGTKPRKDAKHCRHCGMGFGTGKMPVQPPQETKTEIAIRMLKDIERQQKPQPALSGWRILAEVVWFFVSQFWLFWVVLALFAVWCWTHF